MYPNLIIGTLCVMAACGLLLAYCLLTMSKRAGAENADGPLANLIKAMEQRIMNALANLQTAAAQLRTDVTTVGETVTRVGTDIGAAIQKLIDANTGNDPAIQAVADLLTASSNDLQQAGSSLTTAATNLEGVLTPPGGGDGGTGG